jgi:MFS family permease
VPIGIVAFFTATRTVRESVSEVERRLDIPGLAFGTAALFCATYGLIEANQKGWSDPLIVGSLVASAVLVGAFILWEHVNEHAMMPLSFFRIPAFSAGNAVAFSVSLGMFATFFFLSLYMQNPFLRNYSPFEAGLRFLPLTAMIVVTAPNAGRFASKHGSRAPMTYGLILAGTGLLLLSRLGLHTSYWVMAPIFGMMGHGMGSTMAPMTAAVMNAVGPQRAGLGSAMTNTSREVGGVFGIALLGTILFSGLRSSFAPRIAQLGLSAHQALAIRLGASHGQLPDLGKIGLTPEQSQQVGRAFGDAFLSGFHIALLVAGSVLLAAAFVAYRFIPSGKQAREQGHARAPEAAVVEV